MHRLEIEHAAGHAVSDEEYGKIEQVCMNTGSVTSVEMIIKIYKELGMDGINILYSLVMERRRLIETVGELRSELSSVQKEIRHLKWFRDVIVEEAGRIRLE